MEDRSLATTYERPAITTADPMKRLAEAAQAIEQMAQAMRGMADMLRTTNERMGELEREVRLLTKVTPAQAAAINTAVRDRAAALCATYRAAGSEAAVANAIRRAVKTTTGINAMRELPRCEYNVAMQQVQMWDDYKAMKAIKSKSKGKGASGNG